MSTRFINIILLNSIKTWIIALTLSSMLFPSSVPAADVVSIQSIHIKPYNEVLRGFKDTCQCSIEQIVISELHRTPVTSKINDAKPDLILTIGPDAYNKTKSINRYPTIYTMMLNPEKIISDTLKTSGVTMSISPDSQMDIIKRVLPRIKRIGLLYDPARSADFVRKAKAAAGTKGITLVTKEVHTAKEVPALLRGMSSAMDAFWMIPDLTVITPETIKFLLLYSFQNSIPVISFSDQYAEMGALMSLDIDAYDIGKQAGEMARTFLSGTDMSRIPRTDARKSILTINITSAEKLGITVDSDIQKEARTIVRE